LSLRKIVIERVTVVKFRVDKKGSNGTGCFRINVRTDTAELTNMRIAGLRKWGDLTVNLVVEILVQPDISIILVLFKLNS